MINSIARCKKEIVQAKSNIQKTDFVSLEIGKNIQELFLVMSKQNNECIIKDEIQRIKTEYGEKVFLEAILELHT